MNLDQSQLITLIAAFLGSGAIAAIISSLVSLHTNAKNAKLEYITKERGQWRQEIREIAVGLEKAKIPSGKNKRNVAYVREVLAKLKVRINANGLLEDATEKQDRHLWKRIQVIENLCGRVTEDVEDWDKLEEELEYLIQDLSRLLKDDWERTKSEVGIRYWIAYKIKKHRWKQKNRKSGKQQA